MERCTVQPAARSAGDRAVSEPYDLASPLPLIMLAAPHAALTALSDARTSRRRACRSDAVRQWLERDFSASHSIYMKVFYL